MRLITKLFSMAITVIVMFAYKKEAWGVACPTAFNSNRTMTCGNNQYGGSFNATTGNFTCVDCPSMDGPSGGKGQSVGIWPCGYVYACQPCNASMVAKGDCSIGQLNSWGQNLWIWETGTGSCGIEKCFMDTASVLWGSPIGTFHFQNRCYWTP
ncbi:MAG: hypothetical protein FWG18_03000 [Alphaproteobacteria bacterium]|nr:hypothetical protein [Alphaproteobacteria bacterium]